MVRVRAVVLAVVVGVGLAAASPRWSGWDAPSTPEPTPRLSDVDLSDCDEMRAAWVEIRNVDELAVLDVEMAKAGC